MCIQVLLIFLGIKHAGEYDIVYHHDHQYLAQYYHKDRWYKCPQTSQFSIFLRPALRVRTKLFLFITQYEGMHLHPHRPGWLSDGQCLLGAVLSGARHPGDNLDFQLIGTSLESQNRAHQIFNDTYFGMTFHLNDLLLLRYSDPLQWRCVGWFWLESPYLNS